MEKFTSIGERIKYIRTEMGLNRDEFAEFLTVSRNTIARYETNERKPDADFIIIFCGSCEVSADWLLFGILPEDQQQQLSVDEMLLIALCRRHPDEVIHRLRALLTAIALGESEKDVDPSLREE